MSIKFLNSKLLRKFTVGFLASMVLNAVCLAVAHSQVTPSATFFVSAVSQPHSKGSSTSQILLDIPQGNLCETLSDLSRKSGIEFKCPDRLQDHILFPRILEESNWVSLIRVLLEDYNIIEIWNQNGEMTQVYLVGDKGWHTTNSGVTEVKKAQGRKDNTSVAESITESNKEDMPGSSLTKAQLFALLQTSTYRPMPSHIFDSPEFQGLLSYAGIESPRDWLELQKSKRVKQQVQRLIKLKKKLKVGNSQISN